MFSLIFRFRRNNNSQKAATLVEFAIVFPIVLFLVLILIDFILYLVAKGTVERAAKQAAAYAAVVDGLESENNTAIISKIKIEASKIPELVLSSGFVTFSQNDVEYLPPYREVDGNQVLDYANVPLGVSIDVAYRPILPFLPRSIEVSGYAYRERSEPSSLPVPLDCLGRRIIPGQPLPPITSCPCPTSDDPLMRRTGLGENCDCLPEAPGVAVEQDGAWVCIRANQAASAATGQCECVIPGQIKNNAGNCVCPGSTQLIDGACGCPPPLVLGANNQCVCPACGPGQVAQANNNCNCVCKSQFVENQNGPGCVCPPEKTRQGCNNRGLRFNGTCGCQECPPNRIIDPATNNCRCPLGDNNGASCGGMEYVISTATECRCTGICEFPEGTLPPTHGHCICDLPLLYARCGGPQNSNPVHCNCIGGACDTDDPATIASLEAWCGNPRPAPGETFNPAIHGQGGIPVDIDNCGCMSGQCVGAFELNDQGICVCSEAAIAGCAALGQPINRTTCECDPYDCPPQFLVNGSCDCTAAELIQFCVANDLPIMDLDRCQCGSGCTNDQVLNTINGICVCADDPCPVSNAVRNPLTCACECAGNAPIATCSGMSNISLCVYNDACHNNPSCECDADGNFNDPGS
mgnify:CR=1 FL=1